MEMLMDEKLASSQDSVRKWVKDLEPVWGEGLFEVDGSLRSIHAIASMTLDVFCIVHDGNRFGGRE